MATHQTNLIKLEEAIKLLEKPKPKTKKKNETDNRVPKQPGA
jgi:hypothetical protein